jgi:hypothetical protein
MKRYLLAVSYLAVASSVCLGQQIDEDSPWFVRTGFGQSYVLPTNSLLATAWSRSPAIEIGRQTDGSRRWHQLYGLPSYGVGFSFASFGNGELGDPLEAYWFFSWPFVRLTDRIDLTTDFSMGASWHWHAFDQQTNPENTVIGSNLNFLFDWGFYVRTALTPRVSVYTGVDFTHRSNGEFRQPNDGVNVIGPRVALRYNFADERREPIPVLEPQPPPFQPAWKILVGGTFSRKDIAEQLAPIVRADFDASSVTFDVHRLFYKYGEIDGGAEATYDGATGAHLDSVTGGSARPGFAQRWALGVYGGYEHIISRFAVIAQIGYTVARAFDAGSSPRLYERYGWRYRVSDRVSATLAMRLIEGFNATQVEVGASYRLR